MIQGCLRALFCGWQLFALRWGQWWKFRGVNVETLSFRSFQISKMCKSENTNNRHFQTQTFFGVEYTLLIGLVLQDENVGWCRYRDGFRAWEYFEI